MPHTYLLTVRLQDFELEIVGAHIMKVMVCSKSLLKEECYAQGKIRVRPHVISKPIPMRVGNTKWSKYMEHVLSIQNYQTNTARLISRM